MAAESPAEEEEWYPEEPSPKAEEAEPEGVSVEEAEPAGVRVEEAEVVEPTMKRLN